MGKCVTPPTTAEAAPCLTLRSGRRVLSVSASSSAAACRPRTTTSRRPRLHRGSALRCCGAADGAKKKSACGSPGRCRSPAHAAAGRPPPGRRVLGSQQLCDDGGREDSFETPKTPPLMMTDDSDTAVAKPKAKHLNGSHSCRSVVVVAGQTPPSRPPPPTEAEMEAFFAAAELAERRRFAEAYNYDVAVDRPLEGRFEWTPVST